MFNFSVSLDGMAEGNEPASLLFDLRFKKWKINIHVRTYHNSGQTK